MPAIFSLTDTVAVKLAVMPVVAGLIVAGSVIWWATSVAYEGYQQVRSFWDRG